MSNFFKDWTPQMVAARNAKVALGKPLRIETAASLMADMRERERLKRTAALIQANAASGFVMSPSRDEAKLNKTERAYLGVLRARNDIEWIGIQSVTLKLADDCRLTCDFIYLCSGKLTFVDTKGGFIREDSTIKIKVAARMFPWASFVVAQRISGTWTEKVIAN